MTDPLFPPSLSPFSPTRIDSGRSDSGCTYSGIPSASYHRPSISDPLFNTTTRGRQQRDNVREAAGDYGASRAYATLESQAEADNNAMSASSKCSMTTDSSLPALAESSPLQSLGVCR
jgi:hypothetical protein